MRTLVLLLLSGCIGYASDELEQPLQPTGTPGPVVTALAPTIAHLDAPPRPPMEPEGTLLPIPDPVTPRTGLELPPRPVDRGGTTNGSEYIWIDQDITWDVNNVGMDVAHPPPTNWNSPLDYFDGKIEVRLDVTAKHDSTRVWLELCTWHDFLGSTNHTCMHCLDPAQLTTTGEFTCETNAGAFMGSSFWSTGFAAMEHRVKDGTSGRGNDLENEGIGLPISAHYSIVLVPKNQAFSGWAHYPH